LRQENTRVRQSARRELDIRFHTRAEITHHRCAIAKRQQSQDHSETDIEPLLPVGRLQAREKLDE
jgi:hypothetical protein